MRPIPRAGSAADQRCRVLVLDGSRIFGELLAAAVDREQDLECTALVTDLPTAVAEAIRARPDVILAVDLHLPAEDRRSLIPALSVACPSGHILLLTSMHEPDEARPAGLSVVLDERTDLAALLAAARDTRGDLLADSTRPPTALGPDSDVAPPALSRDDLRLLRLVAAGYDNESTARELRVTPAAVRDRLRQVCADLGADSPTEAVAIAVVARMLRLGPDG